MATDINFEEALKQRFAQLPSVVQKAIISANVQKRLRELADTHKLHVDQWQTLENEVMLTLLGIKPVEELEHNVKNELDIMSDAAHALAENINSIVFEPIREELEKQLEHPNVTAVDRTGVEATQQQILDKTENNPATTPSAVAIPTTIPATPPSPKPEATVARAPASGAYKPGEASTARASVVDDPYREEPK